MVITNFAPPMDSALGDRLVRLNGSAGPGDDDGVFTHKWVLLFTHVLTHTNIIHNTPPDLSTSGLWVCMSWVRWGRLFQVCELESLWSASRTLESALALSTC